MHRIKFLRFSGWVAGAAAAATVTYAVGNAITVHCSTSWSPNKPTNVPDAPVKWDHNWDKREPYSLIKPPRRSKSEGDKETEESIMEKYEKKKAKAIRHLVLIRHGQYNLQGETDKERVLTKLGEQQAELTGRRLKNAGFKFDSIISSSMTRAIQTAQIVLKEIGQKDLCLEIQDPVLREGAPCLPEPPVSNWRPELYQYYEDGARIEAAFRKYFHRAEPEQEKDSFEIIVCHANVIRYFACRALQFPGEAWLRISLNNCSLTIISILPSGRVVLRALGDTGHIPMDKVTN